MTSSSYMASRYQLWTDVLSVSSGRDLTKQFFLQLPARLKKFLPNLYGVYSVLYFGSSAFSVSAAQESPDIGIAVPSIATGGDFYIGSTLSRNVLFVGGCRTSMEKIEVIAGLVIEFRLVLREESTPGAKRQYLQRRFV